MIKVDWQQIKTVFLDLDGTLLDLHFDNHFWLEYVPVCYAEQHQIPLESAKSRLLSYYEEIGGTLNWYCVEYWTEKIGLDIVALKHDVADKIAIHPNVVDFLQALQIHGKRVVLVTNAHPASVAIKMDRTGLESYFNRIISSHDLNLAKEEPGFWDKLHTVEPFDPAKTLFIDDNLRVLAAAEHYGIQHLRAIRKPDSRGPEIHTEDYGVISNFAEIIPV